MFHSMLWCFKLQLECYSIAELGQQSRPASCAWNARWADVCLQNYPFDCSFEPNQQSRQLARCICSPRRPSLLDYCHQAQAFSRSNFLPVGTSICSLVHHQQPVQTLLPGLLILIPSLIKVVKSLPGSRTYKLFAIRILLYCVLNNASHVTRD